LPTSQALHQLRDCRQVVVRLDNQVHMIRHQTVTVNFQFIHLLPFPEIRQVVLKISALDENRLAVVAALNNMVGKTGHNHPGLSASPCFFGTESVLCDRTDVSGSNTSVGSQYFQLGGHPRYSENKSVPVFPEAEIYKPDDESWVKINVN
jgi:hypothetical protein